MTTPEQGLEAAFQAHLRSCRYWEAREHRAPVREAVIRAEYNRAAHRAWVRAEAIAREIGPLPGDSLQPLAEAIGAAVAQGLQDAPPVRHIHQHGPSLPAPSWRKALPKGSAPSGVTPIQNP